MESRKAFTLIELLVVITIITMLAGASLGAIFAARESARKAKTKATIAKLDTVIQAKYSEFFTRRLPMDNRRMPPDAMAELKCKMLQEIIRMEMPDRFTDITFPRDSSNTSEDTLTMIPLDSTAKVRPVATFADQTRTTRAWVDIDGAVSATEPAPDAPAGITRTALAMRFWRAVYAGKTSGSLTIEYDSAECLYMIVQADPEARELFRSDEIGDADGDGFMEFHDAWDTPIKFIRWAPGFATESELMTGDAQNDPDPINSRRTGPLVQDPPSTGKWIRVTDESMFRLVPLIYSNGPDKIAGILPSFKMKMSPDVYWRVQFEPADPINKVWIDGLKLGKPVDLSDDPAIHHEINHHTDNIHNHALGMN